MGFRLEFRDHGCSVPTTAIVRVYIIITIYNIIIIIIAPLRLEGFRLELSTYSSYYRGSVSYKLYYADL